MADSAREKTVITAVTNAKSSDRPAAKDACLVVIHGLDLGKKYELDQPAAVVGRSSRSDIQIDQEEVSRSHCKLINTGKGIMLRDLGSTNGTYVNDVLVDEYVLRDGDIIRIGRCIFKFLSGNNIEAAYHEEIYRLTTIDGLTQVHNQRYFLETLAREIGRAQRYRRELSLILFDIDHFKEINDENGHLAGDRVLKQLAQAIRPNIRREDILSRYGGDEFAIILPEIDWDNALKFAEKLRTLVEGSHFSFEGKRIPVTISIGIATITPDLEDAAEFVKRADQSLYGAKTQGRNQVVG